MVERRSLRYLLPVAQRHTQELATLIKVREVLPTRLPISTDVLQRQLLLFHNQLQLLLVHYSLLLFRAMVEQP